MFKKLIDNLRYNIKFTHCTICNKEIEKNQVKATRVARFGTEELALCDVCAK